MTASTRTEDLLRGLRDRCLTLPEVTEGREARRADVVRAPLVVREVDERSVAFRRRRRPGPATS